MNIPTTLLSESYLFDTSIVVGAVDMWVTGNVQLSTYPPAQNWHDDIFIEH